MPGREVLPFGRLGKPSPKIRLDIPSPKEGENIDRANPIASACWEGSNRSPRSPDNPGQDAPEAGTRLAGMTACHPYRRPYSHQGSGKETATPGPEGAAHRGPSDPRALSKRWKARSGPGQGCT